MQRVDSVFRIIVDNLIGDKKWFMCVRSAEAVKGETTRKTGNRTKQTFEGLSHMMGKEVLVYLRETSIRTDPEKGKLPTCIIVVMDCFALESEVSPHTPNNFLS